MRPGLLNELSRVFAADAREAAPQRIVNGQIVPPTTDERREQLRLSNIASELRYRADASIALRLISPNPWVRP